MRYHIRKGSNIIRHMKGVVPQWFQTTKDVVYEPTDVINVVLSDTDIPSEYQFAMPAAGAPWTHISVDATLVEVVAGKKFIRNENWGQ